MGKDFLDTQYYMSKKSWTFWYGKVLFKMGQGLLDIKYKKADDM